MLIFADGRGAMSPRKASSPVRRARLKGGRPTSALESPTSVFESPTSVLEPLEQYAAKSDKDTIIMPPAIPVHATPSPFVTRARCERRVILILLVLAVATAVPIVGLLAHAVCTAAPVALNHAHILYAEAQARQKARQEAWLFSNDAFVRTSLMKRMHGEDAVGNPARTRSVAQAVELTFGAVVPSVI